MERELTPEQQFAAEEAETFVPRALSLGRDPDEVVHELQRQGWSPDAARSLVARVAEDLRRWAESPESRTQLVREAKRQLAAGVMLSLLGVVVTAFTFVAAVAGAFPFILVAFGLFFTGLIVAARGLTRWRLYRRPAATRASP